MEAGVAKWLHRTAGPYALGSFLRLTEVKSGHDWCHCLDMPETRVLCRVQKHQCRSTRHLLQLKSGTRSARLASSQPESSNQWNLLHARSCFWSRESPRALRLSRALTRRSRLCSWDIRRKDANTCSLRIQEVAVVACPRRSGKMADSLVVRSDGEHSLAASRPLRRTVTLIAVQPPTRVFNPQAHRVNNPWRILPLQTKRQFMYVRLNTFHDRL